MSPQDFQVLMAKVIFMVFATCAFCLSKVQAFAPL